MDRITIEEYAKIFDQQTINEAQEEFLKELDGFIDKLDEASNYASTIRQFVKNNKDYFNICRRDRWNTRQN